MFQPHTCHRGHAIRGPRDLRSNGQCAECSRRNEAKYRGACRDARKRLATLESLLSA
jgi:hypothetical protein